MSNILVPLDGSTLAERALALAEQLAHATGDHIRLMRAYALPPVADVPTIAAIPELEATARDYLATEIEPIQRAEGIATTIATEFGPAAPTIVREAAAGDVSYVVMTTHARDGFHRAIHGSVAEHVVREAPVPVLLLPAAAPPGRELRPIKHLAIGLDGSPLSEAVLDYAATLARQLEASISLIRIFDPPADPLYDEGHRTTISTIDQRTEHIARMATAYLQPLVERVRASGVEVHGAYGLDGDVGAAILRMAAVRDADLIVMATHGRSGLDHLRHGSVTEHVLRHSHVPVLAFGREALLRHATYFERVGIVTSR